MKQDGAGGSNYPYFLELLDERVLLLLWPMKDVPVLVMSGLKLPRPSLSSSISSDGHLFESELYFGDVLPSRSNLAPISRSMPCISAISDENSTGLASVLMLKAGDALLGTTKRELFSLCDMLSAAGLAVPGLDPAFEMGEIDFPD